MQGCLFCKIGKGEISSQKIYEDAHSFAFLDINPCALGHIMVIPKIHSETILDLPNKEIEPFFSAVKKVAAMIHKALNPDGFTMGINHGSVSGQTIEHLHFHIIPRWKGDKGGSIHSVVHNPPKERLEEIAKKIRNLL